MQATPRHVLMTGATGFVGGHVARVLLALGHRVAALVRPSSARPASISGQVEWVAAEEGLAWIAQHQPDAVVHLATCYGPARATEMIGTNVLWPLSLLEASFEAGCRLFIGTDTFFAKAGVDYPHMRGYIQSKRDFCHWARLAVQDVPDGRVVNLRLEHVYGPGDRATKFVPGLIARLRRHDAEIDLTPGDQLRDFVFVEDVAHAYAAVLGQRDRLPTGFNELEVGTGQAIQLRTFVETAAARLGSRSALRFGALPHRAGEIMRSSADVCALESLGWRASTTLEAGIRRTVEAAA